MLGKMRIKIIKLFIYSIYLLNQKKSSTFVAILGFYEQLRIKHS